MEACTSKAAISLLHVHERRSSAAQLCFANVLGNENLAEKQIVHICAKSLWHANLPCGTPRGLYLCKHAGSSTARESYIAWRGEHLRLKLHSKPQIGVVHNTSQKRLLKSQPSLIMTLLAT